MRNKPCITESPSRYLHPRSPCPIYDWKGPEAASGTYFALFAERPNGNSFYTSYTLVDGKGVLWSPDKKFYLLGRLIGEKWFQ